MARKPKSFVEDLLSKVGTPIIAATLVGCILKDEVDIEHVLLFLAGLGASYRAYVREHNDP